MSMPVKEENYITNVEPCDFRSSSDEKYDSKNLILPMPLLDSFDLSFIEDPTFEPKEVTTSIRKRNQKKLRKPTKKSRRKKKMKRFSLLPKERRHVIQHNYHDRSCEMPAADDFARITGQTSLPTPTSLKKKGGVAIPFPLKLHELLEKAEEEKLTHIVSWQPHGRAFVVHQPKKFVTELMHRFFRQTKLTSFQRQLNLYGFSRLTRGPDGGGYYHELFLRGRPYLTQKMVRTKIKGTGFKAASNPACEPDFYAMPAMTVPSDVESSYSSENMISLPSQYLPQVVTPTPSTSTPTPIEIMTLPPASIREMSLPHMNDTDNWVDDEEESNEESSQMIALSNCACTRVKMGNHSFQYIDSFQPNSDSVSGEGEVSFRSIDQSNRRLSEYAKRAFESCGGSPLIFEEGEELTFDESDCDHDEEDPSQDPLALFLKDIGNEFEDDINFGNTFDKIFRI